MQKKDKDELGGARDLENEEEEKQGCILGQYLELFMALDHPQLEEFEMDSLKQTKRFRSLELQLTRNLGRDTMYKVQTYFRTIVAWNNPLKINQEH